MPGNFAIIVLARRLHFIDTCPQIFFADGVISGGKPVDVIFRL